MKLLRTLPPLDARQVITLSCAFVRELPDELYAKTVRHPFEHVDA